MNIDEHNMRMRNNNDRIFILGWTIPLNYDSNSKENLKILATPK